VRWSGYSSENSIRTIAGPGWTCDWAHVCPSECASVGNVHAFTPTSQSLRSQETLANIDVFARDLHNSLLSRNLSQIVDVIFVSDHGMADTSEVEWIYLDRDDILGTFLPLSREFLSHSMKERLTDSLTAQARHGTMSHTMMDGLPLDSAFQKEQTNELFWRSSFVHPTNHNSVASSRCTPRTRIPAVRTCTLVPSGLKKV